MEILIKSVIKTYDSQIAVNIDFLEIKAGEIFGIVGNNGAGKTTLLRLILDLIKPDHGEIKSGIVPVSKSEIWKNYTASFLGKSFLIDFLTPEEYFHFIARLYGIKIKGLKARLNKYNRFMNDEILNKNKYIRQFSSGNKQKIGIIGALLAESRILILDEPFNCLDPSSQNLFKMLLKNLNEKHNSTILVSSHNLNHMADICSRIILMENGGIIRNITVNNNDIKDLAEYFNQVKQ